MLPGGGLALAVCLVALVLAAAKAHGRQVRVAREAMGVHKVDFRGENDPRVEALWRKDRVRFWAGVATVALSGWLAALAGWGLSQWPLWGALAAVAALAFASGFIVAGLWAWGEAARGRRGRPALALAVQWVSFGWWTLVAVALAVVWLAAR